MAVDFRSRQQLVLNVKRQASAQLVVGARQAVVDSYRELGRQLPKDIQTLGKALDLNLIPEGRLKKANLQIAEEAQRAVVNGYRSRLPRRSAPYRPESRLVHRLGETLASPTMTQFTTSRRISFINQTELGREAVHWYRVNYGARGPNLAQGRQPQTFNATVNGQNLFSLRDETQPAPASFLPIRFNWQGSTFWPGRNTKGKGVRVGAGIRAARFTDLGLQVVARRLGEVYFEMIRNYALTKGGEAKFQQNSLRIKADLRFNRFGARVT